MGLGAWLAAGRRPNRDDAGHVLGAIDETTPDDLEEEAYLAGVRDGIAWATSRRGARTWGGWESERLEETLSRLADLVPGRDPDDDGGMSLPDGDDSAA